jgi:hypothetical protein
MSNNNFQEPQPFSINENLLEQTLVAIGSGSNVERTAHTAKVSSVNNEELLSNVSPIIINDIKKKVKKFIKKLLYNNVVSNSSKASGLQCKIDEDYSLIYCEVDGIIYKIQGTWTGSEVIIFDSDSDSLMVVNTRNGSDWENVTDNFIIK